MVRQKIKINDPNKTVLITGANRGMGLGYVAHYLKKGLRVVATAKYPDKAEKLHSLQNEYEGKLLLLALDVTSEKSIFNLVDQLKRKEFALQIVINNAGISIEEDFGRWTMATFETQFRINTFGPALVSQALIPFMEKGSKLIQISSGMGSIQWNINPENGLDGYAASKAALNIITQRLAEKLKAKGIIAFALDPGWVQTEMGGPEAPTTIDEAVQKITTTIERMALKNSGSFMSDNGNKIPW